MRDAIEFFKVSQYLLFVMLHRHPGQRCACRVIGCEQGHGEWDMKLLLAQANEQPQHLEPLTIIIRLPPGSFEIGDALRLHNKFPRHTLSGSFLTPLKRGHLGIPASQAGVSKTRQGNTPAPTIPEIDRKGMNAVDLLCITRGRQGIFPPRDITNLSLEYGITLEGDYHSRL